MPTHGNDLVREARKRAGLTQRELARRAGTTQSSIARLESGRTRPAFDEVLRLVRLSGYDLDVMLTEHDSADWHQARRNLAEPPGERAAWAVEFGRWVRTWMPASARDAWPEFGIEPILHALAQYDVQYVVVGGVAAAAHGSILPTYDLDLVPEPGEANQQRLRDALESIGAVEWPDPEGQGARRWRTDHGVVEVRTDLAGASGFADVAREAVDVSIAGCSVRVASLADVIRTKQARSRPMDQRVLPVLREILANRDLDAK